MWIRRGILIFWGLTAGFGIAGAYVAFISTIGIITRLAQRTHTARWIRVYEMTIIAGVTFGTFWYLYRFSIALGNGFLMVLGGFAGVFVGCLAGALAELVDVIPIVSRRTGLRSGIVYVIVAFAIGKALGVLLQYFVLTKME